MDYNKLEAAREKFKKAEKTGYYNSRWFAVSDLFDALLEPAEPKEIFQEVPHRAECAFCLDESGSYTCIRPAHPAYQAKGDGSIDRATDGRITEEPILACVEDGYAYVNQKYPGFLEATKKVANIFQDSLLGKNTISCDCQDCGRLRTDLLAKILADGCEPDPADDGPEVKILRKKENHGHKS